MIKDIIDVIKSNDAEIIIKNNIIHIINYINIKTMSYTNIEIKVKDRIIFIKGHELIIKKLDSSELIISGIIERIEFINE